MRPRRIDNVYLTLALALLLLACPKRVLGVEPAAAQHEQFQLQEHNLKISEHELAKLEYNLKVKEFWFTIWGLFGSAIALIFGYIQYRKADRWKRAEFLANEMRAFFDNSSIKHVKTMIDWAPRRINLFQVEETEWKNYPIVTRKLQISALRPHTLVVTDGGSDSEADAMAVNTTSVVASSKDKSLGFSREEVQIRDMYDLFLDYLERFSSYLQSHLVSRRELDPYLRYWIDDIADFTKNRDDAAWTCALLSYIEFYKFSHVRYLFKQYGYDISTSGALFQTQRKVLNEAEPSAPETAPVDRN